MTPTDPPRPTGRLRLVDAAGREWWTVLRVLEHLGRVGKPIKATTWHSWVSRGRAPGGTEVDGQQLWPADVIVAWDAARPGSGWRRGTGRAATTPPTAT